MAQPIPPPPGWLFHTPILAAHRTLWRLFFGLFFLPLYAYLNIMGSMDNFPADILDAMDKWQSVLLAPWLMIMTFLSGQGTHQAAEQETITTRPIPKYSRFIRGSRILRSTQSSRRQFLWHVFWIMDFVFGPRTYFQTDVLEAWNRHLSHELPSQQQLLTFEICIDNGIRIQVPCARNLDDKAFLTQLHYFYGFAKACNNTSMSRFGLRSLGRVEVSRASVQPVVSSCFLELNL